MESWGLCPICKSGRSSKKHTSACAKQMQKINAEKPRKTVVKNKFDADKLADYVEYFIS